MTENKGTDDCSRCLCHSYGHEIDMCYERVCTERTILSNSLLATVLCSILQYLVSLAVIKFQSQ